MGWKYFKREAAKGKVGRDISGFGSTRVDWGRRLYRQAGMAAGSGRDSFPPSSGHRHPQTSGICKNSFVQFSETLTILSYSFDACLPQRFLIYFLLHRFRLHSSYTIPLFTG
jgi:hypothetical protein